MRRATGVVLALSTASICFLLAPSSHAQTSEDVQVWSAVLGTADLPMPYPRVAFWLDTHIRRSDASTVGIVRPAVGLHVTPWLSFWQGYAWIPTSRDATDDRVNEHRSFQQLIAQHSLEIGLSLQTRLRFEQRFSDAGEEVGFRFRDFVRVGWQFSKDVPLGAVVWDELFLGLNETDWGARSGFDQNRFFVGPFWQAASYARLEVGYLSLFVERADSNLLGHVAAVNLFLSYKP
jgi:hypothetical protein